MTWLTHIRPDICASVVTMSQIAQERFDQQESNSLMIQIKRFNSSIDNYILSKISRMTSYKSLLCPDSIFSNYVDLGTQLGYIISLIYDINLINWLPYASYKCRRVVQLVQKGETYTFTDRFNAPFILKRDLERIVQYKALLITLTDSDSLFDVMVKSTKTTEQILMRKTYERGDISNIG